MARLELEQLRKVYPGGVVAVDGVDLAIEDREFVVLVGPSGCGKSTTLRMIAGLEEIDGGTLTIDGRVANGVPAKDRDLAMVFQNYALYPHLTVARNIAFSLERRRAHRSRARALLSPAYRGAAREERAEIDARVARAAELLGLGELLDRKPAELSGGQRQRVALGRAIVREPAAFLFDEPLSNLDAKLRVEMRAELKALHRRLGATSIYVTHDQEEAMTLGDRLVVLEGGFVQQVGTPREVYERPANRFVAGFLGTPSMNFVAGRLVEQGGRLRFESGGEHVELPGGRAAGHAGREVALGVRPDKLVPGRGGAFELEVELVENLGDRVDVTWRRRATGERLVSRVPPSAELVEGAVLPVAVDADAVHLFEADGEGRRLEG